jgi:hypothetical protein
MIWGAGSRNAVAVAQRGASRAFARLIHTLLPFRAAGYASANGADPRVGAARTIHASCLSCLAAGDASASAAGRAASWTCGTRAINAVAATAVIAGVAGAANRSARCALAVCIAEEPATAVSVDGAVPATSGTTVPVHAGLARGTATGRAAHLIIRAARPVEAGFARGTTHTGASAGVACEALAAITRSG